MHVYQRIKVQKNRKEFVTKMGMAAGQARLLSITARMTDNEMRSQLITNSKLRLADSSSEASSEYMQALNSSELTYLFYDDTGAKKAQNLTAGILMNFSELKTQYGLVNSSGQLMVSSTDKVNYEKSENLSEFLACYDVPLYDNPKYGDALKNLYGDDYSAWYDNNEDNLYKWYEGVTTGDYNANTWISEAGSYNSATGLWDPMMDYTQYQAYLNKANSWIANAGLADNIDDVDGLFGNWINTIKNGPGITEPPVKPKDTDNKYWIEVHPTIWELWEKAIANGGCWDKNSEKPSGSDAYHVEHILTHMLEPGQTYKTSNGITYTIPNDPNGHTSVSGQADSNWPASSETAAKKVRERLETNKSNIGADGNSIYNKNEVQQRIIDLYFDSVVSQGDTGAINASGNTPVYSSNGSDVSNNAANLMQDVKTMTQLTFDDDTYNADLELYNKKLEQWKKDYSDLMFTWMKKCENLQNTYKETLDNLPPQQVPDENDPKYEWYKNLWYRMGGISETKKSDNSNAYKELDSTLMNNSEWLQFALEHGVLSLEQVNFSQDGSDKYPNIGDCDWVSIQYKNAADISSQQNDLKIAKAEVKYKNALTDIENQDKKYDQDLKKLDTEHNALQTEYDSVKGVIEKNVERSFKAFS